MSLLRLHMPSRPASALVAAILLATLAPAVAAAPAGGDVTPSASVPLAPVVTYPSGSVALASTVRDMTGDGRADVLMTTGTSGTPSDNRLMLSPQLSDGTLGAPKRFPLHGSGAFVGWDLATGDVTGDGLADVAVVAGPGVDVFVAKPTGGVSGPRVVGGVGQPRYVESEDVDDNGRSDLVVGSDIGLFVLRSLPTGIDRLQVSIDPQTEIEVADLSGDGLPDIVGCSEPCAGVDTWIQQTDGSFVLQSYASGPLGDMVALAVGDVTGDGLADVVRSHPDQGVEVLPQAGDGTLGAPVAYVAGPGLSSLVVADVDGDSLGDVVGSHPDGVGIYHQQPDGTLGPRCSYPGLDGVADIPKGVAAGDVTGDGLLDVVVADSAGANLAVFEQLATGASLLTVSAQPDQAAGGETVTISGQVTLEGGGCLPQGDTVLVERTDAGGTQPVGDAALEADGSFSITDVPPSSGSVVYTATWDGDTRHTGATDQAAIQVVKAGSSMTLAAVPDPVAVGETVTLTGDIDSDTGEPVGVQTVQLTRTNPDSSQTQLPDALTDADGAFVANDSPPGAGVYTYTAVWPGDAAHEGSSAQTSVTALATTVESDFNGDGDADLAIGVVTENVGSVVAAGAVNVLYGSPNGLTSDGNQFWSQDSPGISDQAEEGDQFGYVSSGDLNADGFADLIVGVPTEDVGSIVDAGAFHVLYGSPAGLTSAGEQFWHQDSPDVEDVAEADDIFGLTFAPADFDGDGFTDVAVNAVAEDVGVFTDAGAVHVLHGGPGGLTADGDQVWHQDSPGILDQLEACNPLTDLCDGFGSAMTAHDFNGDGYVDLAVGASAEDLANKDVGVAHVLYGSADGLTSMGNQLWHQDSPDIKDRSEPFDYFGSRMSSGDYNGDGYGDLAVTAFAEDVGTNVDNGAVNVLYGSDQGLTAAGNQYWNQDSRDVLDQSEPCNLNLGEFCDYFGWGLASGDFNGDGITDLGIGATGEDLAVVDAGAAHVLYGSSTGLTAAGNQLWHQDSPDINDNAEGGDALGWEMGAGDFGNGPEDDLVAGVPWENVSTTFNGGAANVIYGAPAGLSAAGDQYWNQNSGGILDQAEQDDFFAWALSSSPHGAPGGGARGSEARAQVPRPSEGGRAA